MTDSASPRVFLSHSSDDKDDVQRLRKALTDRGIAAWEDALELRLGASLDALKDAIQSADGFVLYLTPESIGSNSVQQEAGWAREAKGLLPGYAILPILRGLKRPALELLFPGTELVSLVLDEDEPIEHAVPAIVQALGLAATDATPRPDPEPAPPMAELLIELAVPPADGGRRGAHLPRRPPTSGIARGRGASRSPPLVEEPTSLDARWPPASPAEGGRRRARLPRRGARLPRRPPASDDARGRGASRSPPPSSRSPPPATPTDGGRRGAHVPRRPPTSGDARGRGASRSPPPSTPADIRRRPRTGGVEEPASLVEESTSLDARRHPATPADGGRRGARLPRRGAHLPRRPPTSGVARERRASRSTPPSTPADIRRRPRTGGRRGAHLPRRPPTSGDARCWASVTWPPRSREHLAARLRIKVLGGGDDIVLVEATDEELRKLAEESRRDA